MNLSPVQPYRLVLILLISAFCLSACGSVNTPPASLLEAKIIADSKEQTIQFTAGRSVQQILTKAGITLGSLDRVDPPSMTILTASTTIQVTRIREEYINEETSINFSRQTVRNESLPEGQTVLIQAGVNGLKQTTFRTIFENDQQTTKSIIKETILKEARPEIVMVGVQSPFTSIPIEGTIAYLTSGNAWIMHATTGTRKPVVSTGDLDGRIFRLSSDGTWLLYSRTSTEKDTINTLWAVDVTAADPTPVDLEIKNIIHYAEWVPGKQLVLAYSTVEPRLTAPGWQANNDLHIAYITVKGKISTDTTVVDPNAGGVYGWWGTTYAWSPNGKQLAFARPDGIGLVNLKDGSLNVLQSILPLQTRADWAWVPPLAWSPLNNLLFSVVHSPVTGLSNPESSPIFDLSTTVIESGSSYTLVPQSGMFAYPSLSALTENDQFQVAFLQAIFPEQSESSRYRLVLMDRDGSNQRRVFPAEGAAGLEPQTVCWGPEKTVQTNWVAFLYQKNLWFLNTDSGMTQQVTGDSLISLIDWK